MFVVIKFSIRGIILTLDKLEDAIDLSKKQDLPQKVSNKLETKPKFSILENIKQLILKEKLKPKSNKKLDIVYIIWSVDEWKTFRSQVARQRACRSRSEEDVLKTHDFFLQDVDKIFEKDQILQLVICHQIDEIIYYDSNNENCYNFKLVSNTI
jgi:hypothetical protein